MELAVATSVLATGCLLLSAWPPSPNTDDRARLRIGPCGENLSRLYCPASGLLAPATPRRAAFSGGCYIAGGGREVFFDFCNQGLLDLLDAGWELV